MCIHQSPTQAKSLDNPYEDSIVDILVNIKLLFSLPMAESKTFGEFLREARKAKKLSQRKLAALIDVNFTYLSKIENNEMPAPSEEKIQLLAEHLELDSDELFALAGRTSEELTELALQMPKILREAKNLTEEEQEEFLQWIKGRKAKRSS